MNQPEPTRCPRCQRWLSKPGPCPQCGYSGCTVAKAWASIGVTLDQAMKGAAVMAKAMRDTCIPLDRFRAVAARHRAEASEADDLEER